MATSTDPQKLEILNHMGLQHSRYQDILYTFALSSPSAYTQMRADVIDKVKDKAIEALHTQFYELLKYGKVGGSQVIFYGAGKTKPAQPMYPEHDLNEFCLGACRTMEKIIDKALAHILQPDAEAILKSKYTQVGAQPTETP